MDMVTVAFSTSGNAARTLRLFQQIGRHGHLLFHDIIDKLVVERIVQIIAQCGCRSIGPDCKVNCKIIPYYFLLMEAPMMGKEFHSAKFYFSHICVFMHKSKIPRAFSTDRSLSSATGTQSWSGFPDPEG